MSKQDLAVALCRVSSIEQLENNSLAHQKGNVLKAAVELGVVIPDDAVWEGAVSSKKGVNFKRKDLRQIYEYCQKNKAVRYVIVQEVDRFMRSPDEQTYFYVKFWHELRVKIWFADKPELNEDTHIASLMRYMEGWRAAGSNEERQNKSINGQNAALKEGRWPFAPKPGYKGGRKSGIPEIHPLKGPALRNILLDIVNKRVTPSQGLVDLNKSEFMKSGHSLYKMDKFRKIVTDPFYAGVVEINKQVKYRNENGLHDPLITLEQHHELVRIMDKKKKTQSGPRKNGNPEYPLSNLVSCKLCIETSTIPRYAGYKHSNGKNILFYHKYRCRACNRYLSRDELHEKVEQTFRKSSISPDGTENIIKSLDIVWKQKEAQAKQEAVRLTQKIKSLNEDVSNRAIAAIDPSNLSIKPEILSSIAKMKDEAIVLSDELTNLTEKADTDKEKFLRFAFDFVENMGMHFLSISHENRLRCKQVIFPAGFYLDENNKVYTPEISPLFTLQTKKKDTEVSDNSHLVRVKRL